MGILNITGPKMFSHPFVWNISKPSPFLWEWGIDLRKRDQTKRASSDKACLQKKKKKNEDILKELGMSLTSNTIANTKLIGVSLSRSRVTRLILNYQPTCGKNTKKIRVENFYRP